MILTGVGLVALAMIIDTTHGQETQFSSMQATSFAIGPGTGPPASSR